MALFPRSSVTRERPRRVPSYVWTFFALAVGIFLGGLFPDGVAPVVAAVRVFIELIILLVPALIFFALAPAIATLIRRGLAGKFAASVIAWYIFSSLVAGLFGLAIAALIFDIPFSLGKEGTNAAEAVGMLRELRGEGGVTFPLLAIAASLLVAILAIWVDSLYRILQRIERGVARVGGGIAYVILPLILGFGITIGATFGARLGMGHYGLMVLYTFGLCAAWWAFYVFVLIRLIARKPAGPLLRQYYIPTALFAAGTMSSLATLPVNLYQAKKYGVRDEVADFVIPFGAVVNMDASALAYMAYAPFVISYLFGLEVSWILLIIAWPVLVLYSLAAPGLPAGMGTALWSSVLFASLLGLEEPMRATFVATWLALSGGLPDMFRTATNTTSDGFVAVVFDSLFDRFFAVQEAAVAGSAAAVPIEPVRP